MPAIYLLEIHISDVARHVLKDSEIDKEAHIRRESKYIPGVRNTQIPMLPFDIGNLCSLNQEKKRYALTLSVIIN